MAENTQVRQLFRDALSGKLNRREVFQRGIALGLSANVIGMLALNANGFGAIARAAEEGKPVATFQPWQLNLHGPNLIRVGEALGVEVQEAPTTNFGFDRFVAEANDKNSSWDFYGGVTPFLEMISLANSGTIEPWTQYMPEGLFEDLAPATTTEGSYNGQFYVWPLLLDINVMMWHSGILEKAGLDTTAAPVTWDDQIAAAQKIMDSGAAPYGIVFDVRDWRSLIPITHSISIDVYDKETGLFQYASDPAVEALEIMKRMQPLTIRRCADGRRLSTTTVSPDEASVRRRAGGYYFKYQNAGFQFSANWPDPSKLRLGRLPKTEDGVGGTVFWDTGAVLFTYGANKAKAVEYLSELEKTNRCGSDSITGNPDEGTIPVGQLPVLQSLWAEWETNPPDFIANNPWTQVGLRQSRQRKRDRPTPSPSCSSTPPGTEWIKYLSGETADAKTAMQNAQDAALADVRKERWYTDGLASSVNSSTPYKAGERQPCTADPGTCRFLAGRVEPEVLNMSTLHAPATQVTYLLIQCRR